jgi:hypothetical protein
MNCQEAAEFVSCLCDGETIPRPAAEHIGECETCRARLAEYAQIGAELRRAASLQLEVEPAIRVWKKDRSSPTWWEKGWGVVRIPRFVFALLIVAIVALGSSLVVVKVRARTQGTVLMLTAKPSDGAPLHCALSLEDEKRASCPIVANHAYEFRVISATPDRIELGVRVGSPADVSNSTANLGRLVEKPYLFEPGQKLEIPIPGGGTVVVTGELMDYMPSYLATDPSEQIDAKAGELRLISPLLFRGKEVVLDFGQESVTVSGPNEGIDFYVPGQGIFYLSLSPLEGSVKGHIDMSRIAFELDGESYTILSGAPIARGADIWVLHLANRKPANYQGNVTWGGGDLNSILASSSESK